MNLIGFDFSINKPAACIFNGKDYIFMSWPYNQSDKNIKSFKDAGVQIIERTDNKDKGENITDKIRYEVENSQYLSYLILESVHPYLDEDTILGFEGLSYGSSGANGIQLGAYKYMLMDRLNRYIPLNQMYTYSPITIKSIAGCAKKGMGKSEMIEAFIKNSSYSELKNSLINNRQQFRKKGDRSWIDHLDDLIDAYWSIETMRVKENF